MEIEFQSLGWKDPLEKGVATPSSIHAWKIPWKTPGVVLLDHMVVLFFSFSRNPHNVLHSGWTSLYYHQQYKWILFTPHPL